MSIDNREVLGTTMTLTFINIETIDSSFRILNTDWIDGLPFKVFESYVGTVRCVYSTSDDDDDSDTANLLQFDVG